MTRVWFAKDADFLGDPAIVELGERHGPGGPLLIDALLGLAKLARKGGEVTAGYTALARRSFVDGADTVKAILRDAVEFGVLEVDEMGPVKCDVRFPQWDRWQASFRKTRQREREAETGRDTSVTERDTSVTNRDAPVRATVTGTKDKQQQKESSNDDSVEPARLDDAAKAKRERSNAARQLFDYWREKCDHPTSKFTGDRKRKVEARLKDGYTVEQIQRGIEGAAQAAFINPDGKKFDDLELICRSGSKLEDFIDRAGGGNDGDFIASLNSRRK